MATAYGTASLSSDTARVPHSYPLTQTVEPHSSPLIQHVEPRSSPVSLHEELQSSPASQHEVSRASSPSQPEELRASSSSQPEDRCASPPSQLSLIRHIPMWPLLKLTLPVRRCAKRAWDVLDWCIGVNKRQKPDP
ncbi:hypothetical protein SASPL_141678 [Salvia splendens]|uniref:Uncharacterized protein n=1 Tax=Salvia splendens TaxID=180675 RepID=A0A8X8WK83_SALSN|nr:hypothetical protein SASPL_141678 [Salvia splendens]